MNRGNLSRRGFLAKTMGGMVMAGLPLWYAQEILVDAQEKDNKKGPTSPNDRITMAAIGTGTNRTHRTNQPLRGERGFHIMREAMGQPGVQMIAVCDVDRPNAEFAAQAVGRDCQILEDYRRLLENRSIDAVTIGTPDHWHAIIAVAAMRAGKDVYCEKPLTLTLEEGRTLVRVARQTNRILQTGSQQRSDARFRLACELVRNNRIGRVQRITTLIGDNPVGGPFQNAEVPQGLNWDFWLGPTPQAPYQTNRCHYNFRWWYQYSGGKMTDWGAHHNDIAQWALGMDESGPISVRGTGAAPSTDANSYNCHPTFEVTYTYGNGANGGEGTQLICRSGPPANFIARQGNTVMNNGVLFEGEDGKWIFVNRSTIFANDGNHMTSRLITEPLAANATRLEVANGGHMANFMTAQRTRRQAICHPGVGHRSCSVCHLGTIATRFFPNQTLRWNPQDERFTGDNAEAANRHLSRPYRDNYRMVDA